MRNKAAASQDKTTGVTPKMPWRVSAIKVLPNYSFLVTFLDGTKGEVDMSKLVLSGNAGVFEALRDNKLFSQAFVDLGAVTWPGEIDLAPDAMYQEIKLNGKWNLAC